MKTYQDFFPLVYPDVPGVTPDMATQAIQNTIIEFCEKSLIHQVTLDPLTLVPDVDTYDLEPDGMCASRRSCGCGSVAPS